MSVALYVVGVGPGEVDYLTIKALKVINSCSVLAGWRRVLEDIKIDNSYRGKEVIVMSSEGLDEKIEKLVELSKDRDVALLVRGDPCVGEANLLKRLKVLCSKSKTECIFVSGVSPLNLALARIGIDLSEVFFVSLHTLHNIDENLKLLKRIAGLGRYIVIYPRYEAHWVKKVANVLLESIGCDPSVHILTRLTMKGESVDTRMLSELLHINADLDPYTILIVEPCKGGSKWME